MDEFFKYKLSNEYKSRIYKSLTDTFFLDSAIYPGSYIDVLPSLYIPNVTYIDNYNGTNKFFRENMLLTKKYLRENKNYKEPLNLKFVFNDYEENIPDIKKADAVISLFSGLAGQKTKHYLKKDGILFCNDSHGDATLASLDEDYELIAVMNNDGKINSFKLEEYFKAKDNKIDKLTILTTMKPPRYIIEADNYIFRKIK